LLGVPDSGFLYVLSPYFDRSLEEGSRFANRFCRFQIDFLFYRFSSRLIANHRNSLRNIISFQLQLLKKILFAT
jgi:hypothetical protein